MQYFMLMIICCLILGLQAAEWVKKYHSAEFPGKCVITPSLILNQGESIKDPSHECRQIVCGINGTAVVQSCGSFGGVPLTCIIGGYLHPDLEYPNCCERATICP